MNSEHLLSYVKMSVAAKIAALIFACLMLISFTERGCHVYTSGCTDEHLIALTFDDGPHPKHTPEILDILKYYDISATFFIVGENANKHEEIIERIINEGHEIGNHTFGHKYLGGKPRALVEREIDLCDDVIFNHAEYNTILFRPPGGIYDATLTSVCAERGYSVVLWSIDTRDWAGTSAKEIEDEVLKYVDDGSIILMHDYISGEAHTAEALKYLIPELKKLGYRFVTVSELIND